MKIYPHSQVTLLRNPHYNRDTEFLYGSDATSMDFRATFMEFHEMVRGDHVNMYDIRAILTSFAEIRSSDLGSNKNKIC